MAAYIRNCLPHLSNDWISPYEILYGKKPSLEHLGIVWCDAYVHINKARRRGGKLGPRAHKLKLIGYDDEYAYCLWDPNKHKIIISWDVVFDETEILKAEYTSPNDSKME